MDFEVNNENLYILIQTYSHAQQQFNNRRDNFDPYGGGAAGGAGAGKINDSIQVPSDAVGMIIGKGNNTTLDMLRLTY